MLFVVDDSVESRCCCGSGGGDDVVTPQLRNGCGALVWSCDERSDTVDGRAGNEEDPGAVNGKVELALPLVLSSGCARFKTCCRRC